MHARLGSGRMRRLAALVAVAGAVFTGLVVAAAPPAVAGTTVYSVTQTIPVPPASNYAGVGGGDGWDLSMTPTSVYNIFHHSSSMTMACHRQSDASPCYPARTLPDGSANNFADLRPGRDLDRPDDPEALRVRDPRRRRLRAWSVPTWWPPRRRPTRSADSPH